MAMVFEYCILLVSRPLVRGQKVRHGHWLLRMMMGRVQCLGRKRSSIHTALVKLQCRGSRLALVGPESCPRQMSLPQSRLGTFGLEGLVSFRVVNLPDSCKKWLILPMI